jgi:riboflavin kinase/FMN adenylyltransferase
LEEIEQQILMILLAYKEYGFEVEQISVQEINDISVSSTKIRNAFAGDMDLANDYLGYDYFLPEILLKANS